MATNEKANEELLQLTAEVYRRRNLSLTARDLLPARPEELEELRQNDGRRLTESAEQALASGGASLAVQAAGAVSAPAITQGFLMRSAQHAFEPLLENDRVKKSASETVSRKERERATSTTQREVPVEQGAPKFWTSRSVGLNIEIDDLNRLPDEVPQIQGGYPNRTLRVPRVVSVNMRNVPRPVVEERGSSWGVRKIGALSVWGAYGARGKGVKVAVLDTGVDADHPDLRGKVKDWAEFDGEGEPVPGSEPHDTDQHGTHCAGTIAGGSASGSWIGVAPEAEIAAALVLNKDKGGGTFKQILAGLDWAITQKVDVISMSLGSLWFDMEPPGSYSEALVSAVASGIPVITAIGNEGSQTTGAPGNDWFAFSVGATDYLDRAAGFSGGRTHLLNNSQYFGPNDLPLIYSKPEVSAPGVAIRSSVPGTKWEVFNGTSMATPHRRARGGREKNS